MSTEQKILAMLNGYTSTKPMHFDRLADLSGLLPDTLMMVLGKMQAGIPATINSAKITKAGRTTIVIWPTGASIPQPTFGRVYPAPSIAPPAITPDVPRTISGKKALELITAQPGIQQNDLVKRLMSGGVSLATGYNAIRALLRGHFITRTENKLYPAGGDA